MHVFLLILTLMIALIPALIQFPLHDQLKEPAHKVIIYLRRLVLPLHLHNLPRHVKSCRRKFDQHLRRIP